MALLQVLISHGFALVDEGKGAGHHKWGFVGHEPGNSLTFVMDTQVN